MKRKRFLKACAGFLTVGSVGSVGMTAKEKADKINEEFQSGLGQEKKWIKDGIKYSEYTIPARLLPITMTKLSDKSKLWIPMFSQKDESLPLDTAIETCLNHSSRGTFTPKNCVIIRVKGDPDVVGIAVLDSDVKINTDEYKYDKEYCSNFWNRDYHAKFINRNSLSTKVSRIGQIVKNDLSSEICTLY
jgi:hypothetical protein